jgi:hypothetical protein
MFFDRLKQKAAADIDAIDDEIADSLAGMLEGKIEPGPEEEWPNEVVSLALKGSLDSHEYHQGEIDRLTREIARAREIAEREIAWRENRLAQHNLVIDAICAFEDVFDRHQVEQGKADKVAAPSSSPLVGEDSKAGQGEPAAALGEGSNG